MADSPEIVTATISAENTGTDALQLRGDKGSVRLRAFDLSLSGIDGHTFHLQRKRSDEDWTAARDIESYTADVELVGEVQGSWDLRLFCKTGNFGTGDVTAELSTE